MIFKLPRLFGPLCHETGSEMLRKATVLFICKRLALTDKADPPRAGRAESVQAVTEKLRCGYAIYVVGLEMNHRSAEGVD